jgi:F-box interacting protein
MESTHKYASLGLGYDLCTRKHKIVRIYYGGRSADKFPISTGCEVYEVNSTGLWRPPKSGILEKPAGWVNKDERSVFAHGHIFWLAQRKLESPSAEMFIISFSLRYEKFGILTPPLLSTPDLITENNTFVTHHLTQLDGRLCLFCTDMHNRWPRGYHIWLLREASTWDLHCQIDLATVSPEANMFMYIGDGIIPIAIVDNGRRILFIQPRFPNSRADSFKLCAYDPVTREIDSLVDTTGFLTNQSMVLKHAALYEESMVFPGPQYEDNIFAMSLVLRRLPMYALERLKCVCRSWRTMIESKRFDVARRTCSKFINY